MRRWRRTGAIVGLLAFGFWSCCDERSSKVGDMSGRLDFAFDWAVKLKFDASMRFDFDGDFAGWAKFSAATGVNLKFQFGGGPAYKRRVRADLDDDGVDESVEVLAFASGDPSTPERVMVSWRGDAYTFDADRCYVMWWEGNTLELLNARCGSAEPALHCQMQEGKSSTMSCNVCAGTGVCTACDASLVSECIAEGERSLSANAGSGGAAGAGGDLSSAVAGRTNATWVDTAGRAGAAGEPASSAGAGGLSSGVALGGSTQSVSVGTSVSVEFDTCQTQVRSLAGTAANCNRTLRDTNALCSERLTDVNVCYLAVQGAGLFVSECSVLGSQACQGVLP